MNDLQSKYYNLNNSFKKKLVFHLGAEAGFFSEYNNMILAMLYCLTNNIKFVLYSEDANFGYKEGWNDYFLPFCDENKNSFHTKYNFRNHEYLQNQLSSRDKLKIQYHKFSNKIDFLTQDLWLAVHNRVHEKGHFLIPELGIDGDLRSACRKLIEITWRYNPHTNERVEKLKDSLNLPSQYIGFHIRRGDKHIEQNPIDISVYFDKLSSIEDYPKNAFVLTDDYNVITDIKEMHLDWNIFTLCKETERGYIHSEFQKMSKEQIKEAHINLFTSIDILNKAQYFVGTYASNPGMYLGMRMDAKKCLSIDLDNWQIW